MPSKPARYYILMYCSISMYYQQVSLNQFSIHFGKKLFIAITLPNLLETSTKTYWILYYNILFNIYSYSESFQTNWTNGITKSMKHCNPHKKLHNICNHSNSYFSNNLCVTINSIHHHSNNYINNIICDIVTIRIIIISR